MPEPAYHVVLPGPATTPTGGFVYDRHMLAALSAAGRLARVIELPDEFPSPSAATCATAAAEIAAIPDGASLLVDGLAFAPLLDVFAAHAERLTVDVLLHHPLCDETGLTRAEAERLFALERRALPLARGIVVTSRHTGERLQAGFGVPTERLRVVHPGVALPGRQPPRRAGTRRSGQTPLILCVASLTRRKGQDVLLRALALLDQPWRLLLAGPPRDAAFARMLRRMARTLGVASRVRFTGALDPAQIAGLYATADLFVLPSFHEGFGIVLAEAAAYGLPIVASDAGAIPEAVAGARHRLVPPGDPRALAVAICAMLAGPQPVPHAPATVRTWAAAGSEFLAALAAFAPR